MTISLNLDVDLQPSVEALAFLKELGYKQKGIQLREKDRNDGASNVVIIDTFAGPTRKDGGHTIGGRDFFTPNVEMLNYIKATYENTIKAAMKRFEKRSLQRAGIGRAKQQIAKYSAMSSAEWKEAGRKLAQNAHNKGIKECMMYWMQQAVARLEQQRTASGAPPRPLTDKYAARKDKAVGFKEPIGKATGQLLDNLAHTGSIRYTTGKAAQGGTAIDDLVRQLNKLI